jgi:translation initiation factor 3 subunit J
MASNWDDGSDDEWDVSDDDLDKRLGLQSKKPDVATSSSSVPKFDDEEDLAVKEKLEQDRVQHADLKKKGNALAERKRAEKERQDELDIARRAMELELEENDKLTPDERRMLEQRRIEDADHALTDDLFGADSGRQGAGGATIGGGAAAAGNDDILVLKDLKDHLKHARKVAECLRKSGKITLAATFFKECLTQSKDVLDDDAVTELIKSLNVIKNEKVQAAKRKVKGQAQKSTKKQADKEAEAKARKLIDTFGDNDKFDAYDVIGENFEDDFF